MSIKHILKSFTTIRKSCALTAAIATLLTLTAIAANVTVSEGMDLVVDPGDTATFDTPMNISTYKVYGTMNVSARDVSATKEAKNYIGGDGKDGVLNVTGVFHDTSNHNGAQLEAARNGGTATINVSEDAMLDLDWKYLYASCYSEETRPATVGECSKTTLNIDGTVWLGEIHAADWYFNGDLPSRSDWPVALEVNIGPRGFLATRCIGGNDKALINVNLRGGKLECRWDRDGIMAGGGAYLTVDFAQDTVSAIDTENHRVVFGNSNRVGFTGNGGLRKTGSGELVLDSSVDDSAFTGDIYVENGTLNYPIVADGIARTVHFAGGTLAVPAGTMVGTTRNGGTITLRSNNGNDIKLLCGGLDELGDVSINVGTGRLFVNGVLVKVGSDKKYVIDGDTPKIYVHEGSLAVSNPLFYRWVVDAKYGGGDSHMQIGEMLFNTDDGWRTGSQLGATASCYNNENFREDEGSSKAIDGSINPDGTIINIGGKFLDWVHSIPGGQCYLQLQFPTPVKLNAYAWFTANDELDITSGNCRTPSAWHWMVSPDGSQWKEITRVTSSGNGIDTDNIVNQGRQAGYWEFPSTDMGDVLSRSTVALQSDCGLYLENGITATIGGLANQGGAVNLSNDTTLRSAPESGATALLAGGGITGQGGVVKAGAGTTLASGINTYTGDTVVSEGTYRISAGVANPRFFKFSFMNREGGCVQFTRLKLVAEDGSVPSYGLAARDQGTAASNLAENEFAPCDGMGWGAGTLRNVFVDDNVKFCSNEDSNFRSIVMRLSNASSRIVGINIMSGNDDVSFNNRYLRAWKLEASTDGVAWTEVAAQAETTRTEANLTWYYESDVPVSVIELPVAGVTATTIPSSSTLEVKPGATLDVETAMTISKLRINLNENDSATPGQIFGFNPAENGTLELVYTGSEPLGNVVTLGLDFESIGASANETLKSWSCTLNGQSSNYRLVTGEGTRNSKLVRPHLLIMVY